MTRNHILVRATLILALSSTAARGQENQFRTWTDSTGQFRIEARFVELLVKPDTNRNVAATVVLERRNQTKLRVPLARLSKSDQNFARRLAAGKKQASRVTSKKNASSKSRKQADSANGRFDWPQWRGPNRDGVSTEKGLLDAWPEGGPPLLWKADGLGKGFSSVSIDSGMIYTLGRSGGGTNLVALKADDGSRAWSTPVGGGDAPNGTPTVSGGLVYGISHGGDLLCANATSGAAVWRKNFAEDFGGKMMSGWGYSESPLVDGDHLVCTPGSNRAMIAALDRRTGKVVWTTNMLGKAGSRGKDGAGYSSIVVSRAGGVKQYVQLIGRGLIGVDAKTGRLLWGYNRIANGTANVPTPIVKDDYVFCSSGYGTGAALIKLNGGRGRISPQEVYFKPGNSLQNHHGGMIRIGNQVYLGHGNNKGLPVCVEMATGQDRWRPGRGPGTGSAAIAAADGHLYFRYQNGVMALIKATPSKYEVKGSFRLPVRNGESWAHPVIANGRLYLRDHDDLLCYDIRKK